MSCGLTNLTVVAHGLPPAAREPIQSRNCWRITGCIAWPCTGPPLGDGQVPEPGQSAEKPYSSYGSMPQLPFCPPDRCHLPNQYVS